MARFSKVPDYIISSEVCLTYNLCFVLMRNPVVSCLMQLPPYLPPAHPFVNYPGLIASEQVPKSVQGSNKQKLQQISRQATKPPHFVIACYKSPGPPKPVCTAIKPLRCQLLGTDHMPNTSAWQEYRMLSGVPKPSQQL